VYLEAPLDLLMDVSSDEEPPTSPGPPARPGCDPGSLDAAARLLDVAERPCFIVGSQLRWSPRAGILERATKQLEVPFFLNGMARGALGPEHPGLFSHSRRHALTRSDLVVVLGTPLDFRVGYGRAPLWNPDARVIQVDLEATDLGKNRTLDLGLQADVGYFLEGLLERVSPKRTPEWLLELMDVERQRKAALRAELDRAATHQIPSGSVTSSANASGGRTWSSETAATSSRPRRTSYPSNGRSCGWIQGRSARSASAPAMRWRPASHVLEHAPWWCLATAPSGSAHSTSSHSRGTVCP